MISNRISSKKCINKGIVIDRECQCSRRTSRQTSVCNTFTNHGTFMTSGCSINNFVNYGIVITKRCGLTGGCDDISVDKFKNYGTLIIHDCRCCWDASQQIRANNFQNYGTIIRCHAECHRESSVVITEIVDIPPAIMPPETPSPQPKTNILPPEASQQRKRSRKENLKDFSD